MRRCRDCGQLSKTSKRERATPLPPEAIAVADKCVQQAFVRSETDMFFWAFWHVVQWTRSPMYNPMLCIACMVDQAQAFYEAQCLAHRLPLGICAECCALVEGDGLQDVRTARHPHRSHTPRRPVKSGNGVSTLRANCVGPRGLASSSARRSPRASDARRR